MTLSIATFSLITLESLTLKTQNLTLKCVLNGVKKKTLSQDLNVVSLILELIRHRGHYTVYQTYQQPANTQH